MNDEKRAPRFAFPTFKGLRLGIAWRLIAILVTGALVNAEMQAQTTIAVTDASSTFNAIRKSDGTIMTDPFADQQTGQPQSDIISLAAGTTVFVNGAATSTNLANDLPGLMMKSGQIGGQDYMMFRVLFRDKNGTKSYQGSYTLLGVDLNADFKPDIIFGVDNSNANPSLIFQMPGTNLNISPNTTSSSSYTLPNPGVTTALDPTTFYYDRKAAGDTNTSVGTTYDTAANSKMQNAALTFAISYANLQAAIRAMTGPVNGTSFSNFTVSSSTVMGFLAFTSQQANAFNQDIFGGAIASNSATSWQALGAFSDYYSADGVRRPVPEPATFVQTALLLLVGGGIALWRKRREKQAVALR